MDCPNCQGEMDSRSFERHLAGEVSVDLCFPCHLIWFDSAESLQLAPAGVLELFKQIHRNEKRERHPLQERFACPRCGSWLRRTEDMSKSGRFRYFRCARDHGRLTPFFDFLREKQFVRALTPAEIARVRAEVRQVQCSGCGAPIDLEHDTSCTHCGAPISILDADAVEKAVRKWSAAAAASRASPDPNAVAAAMAKLRASERTLRHGTTMSEPVLLGGIVAGGDLVDIAIGVLRGLFD
jgi:hypothetical protein